MELQHISHEHPLICKEEHNNNGKKVCEGCTQPLSTGPIYTCSVKDCKFNLHKSCAELSPMINHPFHPEHPLTLLRQPPNRVSSRRCNACRIFRMGFAYGCAVCNINIDIVCAQKPQIVKHESHNHPLISLQRKAEFYCDACGKKREGSSYLCNTCQFWIHESCALLPNTVKHIDHEHDLKLCYSFPKDYDFFVTHCDSCEFPIDKDCWIYLCDGCRYIAHVICPTTPASQRYQSRYRERKNKLKDIEINPIPLPVTDESVNPIAYFLSFGQNKRTDQLNHCSHDHPLVLFDTQITDEFCSESKPSLPNKTKNTETCNGCVQPISPPFYHCAQCRFFLHQSCAELPTEVKHPCHPEHPLTLLAHNPSNFAVFQCEGCRNHCNGFIYKCSTCTFNLDAKCGSLPGCIKHEAHQHPLLQKKKLFTRCNACHSPPFGWSSFGCQTCDFNLHASCALLPRTIRHRYDKEHPFVLHYFPVKNHPAEYYCEVCCYELNPKCWFYHCDECDLSIHVWCLFSRFDEYSNIKFGGSLEVDGHSHLLTFVRETKGDSKCSYCDEQIDLKKPLAFKCAQCDFKLHLACALKQNEGAVLTNVLF